MDPRHLPAEQHPRWSQAHLQFRRLTVEVSLGFLLLMSALAFCGWLAGELLIPATGGPPAGVLTAVLFVVADIGLSLIHETGHAVVGTLTGHPFLWHLRLSARGYAVTLDGNPTRWRRVAIFAAGPVAHALAAGVVLMAVGGWTALFTPAGIAASAGLADALINLLIPFDRRVDAFQIYVGIGQTLRARFRKLDRKSSPPAEDRT